MKYYRDTDGNYINGFDDPPPGAIEVPNAPSHARQKWGDDDWLPLVLTQQEQDLEAIRSNLVINDLLSKRPDEIMDHFGQQNNLPALAEQVALLAMKLKELTGS